MDFFILYIYKVICGQPEPNTKELQAMTNERVKICSGFMKKSCPELLYIHNSTGVTQINSVPLHSRCCSTGKVIDSNNGVQLITKDLHVSVLRDVAVKWYHYYRLRHFPKYMCGVVLDWLKQQPWYLHGETFTMSRLMNSHWVITYKTMYKESIQNLIT
jgi:hypothetical protein